ncbi:MAG TPA: hypothetical protein VGP17_07685 [Solirubrobacteraceae bacterium]|nr:hypothetical protein [Solirubrobacteraceae bacterium]
MRCAVGVDLHGANFAALDDLANVEIANRGTVRGATALGLLDQSLPRLGGEVGRIELRVSGNDRVHEPAKRRVVDVLGDRHKFDAGALQGVADRGVVVAVAGEPVDFVNDHIVQVAAGRDAIHQRAELWPVGGLGGLTTIDVLADDLRVKACGLADTRLSLGGDRIPLGLAVAFGLRAGGDAQIDRGTLHRNSLLLICGVVEVGEGHCQQRRDEPLHVRRLALLAPHNNTATVIDGLPGGPGAVVGWLGRLIIDPTITARVLALAVIGLFVTDPTGTP